MFTWVIDLIKLNRISNLVNRNFDLIFFLFDGFSSFFRKNDRKQKNQKY